jgi:hypothetical protein
MYLCSHNAVSLLMSRLSRLLLLRLDVTQTSKRSLLRFPQQELIFFVTGLDLRIACLGDEELTH